MESETNRNNREAQFLEYLLCTAVTRERQKCFIRLRYLGKIFSNISSRLFSQFRSAFLFDLEKTRNIAVSDVFESYLSSQSHKPFESKSSQSHLNFFESVGVKS